MRIHASYIYDTDTKTFESAGLPVRDNIEGGPEDIQCTVTPSDGPLGPGPMGQGEFWAFEGYHREGPDDGAFNYDPEPTDQLANIALRAAAELVTMRQDHGWEG